MRGRQAREARQHSVSASSSNSAKEPEARRRMLETAIARAKASLAHLTTAVSEGGAVATLVQAIRDQERRQQTLHAELANLDRPRVVPLSVGNLKALLETKAEEWQGLLRKHAPIARQMVRKLVEGRIALLPPNARLAATGFMATGTLANFFSGIICPQAVASPTGTGRILKVSDHVIVVAAA